MLCYTWNYREWSFLQSSPRQVKADIAAADSLVHELIEVLDERCVFDPMMQELCSVITVTSWTEGSSLLYLLSLIINNFSFLPSKT